MKDAAQELIDVKTVATICGFSTHHVYRLVNAEEMPPPLKLRRLNRWSRTVIEHWIADGCPSCTNGGAK